MTVIVTVFKRCHSANHEEMFSEYSLHCSQIIQNNENAVAEDTSQPDRNVGVMERDSNGHVTRSLSRDIEQV